MFVGVDLHTRTPLDLRRLLRPDLEALAGLKLWEELGVSMRESRPALAQASAAWLTSFLEKGAPCIGASLLDSKALVRARAHYALGGEVALPEVPVSTLGPSGGLAPPTRPTTREGPELRPRPLKAPEPTRVQARPTRKAPCAGAPHAR